jgi:hypothetical protein
MYKKMFFLISLLLSNVLSSCSELSGFLQSAPPLRINENEVDEIVIEKQEGITYHHWTTITDKTKIQKILVSLKIFSSRNWSYPLGDTAPALPYHCILSERGTFVAAIWFGNGGVGGYQEGTAENLQARFTNFSQEDEVNLLKLIKL